MDGFLLGRRGGHRPNPAGRTRDPSRHVPPASMALSPPHSTPQHPAARAHTFGLTVHDELNHTSRTPALCERIQAPSRHMTKHRSGGNPRDPVPLHQRNGHTRTGLAVVTNLGRATFAPTSPDRGGPTTPGGTRHIPFPLSTSADSEHPSTGEMVSEHLQSGHQTFQEG